MRKRTLGLVVSFLLVATLVLTACPPPEVDVIQPQPPEEVGPTTITILHTGDMHGYLDPFKPRRAEEYIGGMARIATLVNQIRDEQPNTILLDGGDTIHGTNLANQFKGEPVIEAMNALGYTAMVVGNHDFNFGLDILQERAEQANFPLLGANVRYRKTGKPVAFLPPYTIVEVGGLKVGIIGLTTIRTPYVTHPRNVEELEFLDSVAVARDVVKRIGPEVDFIVLLAHMGGAEEEPVLLEVPGIGVSVSADTHEQRVDQVRDVILVDSGEHGKVLGRLDIVVKDGTVISFTHEFLPITPAIEEYAGVDAVLTPYREALGEKLAEVVGVTEVVLEGEREAIRSRETNLGNLVADVMRERAGADIAIQNAGGIRASIDVGSITLEEIFTVLPFDNYIVALELTGEMIWQALENGLHDESPTGAFPQVSGMTFTFVRTRPSGNRVVEVTIGGKPLDLHRTYIVATNCFLAAGGDRYGMLKEAKVVLETGDFLRDAVAAYIRERGAVRPEVEGRILQRKGDPRNVIFFHTDGYGLSHWNALRYWLVGPDDRLNWDSLPYLAPYTGNMRDAVTGSSCGGATVHAYGVKLPFYSVGMDGHQEITALSGRKMSIMEEARDAGFATALVQTEYITHPGTAAFVVSVEVRWPKPWPHKEIAKQLIESGVDVILGGGEKWLLPEGVPGHHGTGKRIDGLNLVERAKEFGYTVVYTREELRAVAADPAVTRVLGVFASGSTFNAMPEERLRAAGLPLYWPWAPTIAEMSEATLEILSRSPKAQEKGIFIVAEEEGTDDLSNAANARGSFEAGKRADEALRVFANFVRDNPNTLLLTTADSSAGGKQITGASPEIMAWLVPEGKAIKHAVNTRPDGTGEEVYSDGVDGAGTELFLTAPDRAGNRWPFAVVWATNFDVSGGILARAKGLNAEKVTELGVVDNTDIYRIMYYTLFGKWLGERP